MKKGRKYRIPLRQKNPGTWDYDLNFREIYIELVNEIYRERAEITAGNITNKRIMKFAFIIAGLIQLRNGARIGEALEALNYFCQFPGYTKAAAKVQKRKDEFYRRMFLPEEIISDDLIIISDFITEKFSDIEFNRRILVSSVSRFFHYYFGFSTHAFRHSFITFESITKRQPIQVIAKMVGRRSLDHLDDYVSQKAADIELEKARPFPTMINVPARVEKITKMVPLRKIK